MTTPGGSTAGELRVDIEAPVYVTRTLPFTTSARLANTTPQAIDVLTAALSLHEDISSTLALYDVTPAYHTVSDLHPGAAVTVTWTVTPLVAGASRPLVIAAYSGDLFGIDEMALVVGEPGSPPPLTVGGACNTGNPGPGQPVSLSAYLLDQTLEPFVCPQPGVTATVLASPGGQFSTTLPLEYQPASGLYEGLLELPADAPAGQYQVHYQAGCPGHSPAESWSAFWVAPPLDVTMDLSADTIQPYDTLTITVHVRDRGQPISTAGVWADIVTPGGTVRMPLLYSGGADYVVAFRPADLSFNFGGLVRGGTWQIQAAADYKGSAAGAADTLRVLYKIYLPLVVRGNSSN